MSTDEQLLESEAEARVDPPKERFTTFLVTRSVPVFVLCVLGFRLWIAAGPIGDPDTWWHLRAGQNLWETHQFSGPEPGGSPLAAHPWMMHEWLPELAAYAAWSVGGTPGVAWLYCLGVLSIFGALYWSSRSFSRPVVAAATTAAGVMGMSSSLTPRPQLVTFLFLIVMTVAWLRTIEDLKARWWMVPATWIWACSHGMWFTGPVLGAAVVVGLAIDRRAKRRRLLQLAVIPVASVAVALLTPVGASLVTMPFTIGDYTHYISEWDPPSILQMSPAVTVAMIGVVALVFARRGKRVSWALLSVIAVALGWTLLYTRTVTLGAAIMTPVLALVLQSLFSNRSAPMSRRALGALLAASSVVAAAVAFVVPNTAARPAHSVFPTALDAQIAGLPAGTVVLNDFVYGGWMVWAHRNVHTAVDGRIEIYDVAYLDAYFNAKDARAGWDEYVARINASYALFPRASPLATALIDRLGWQVVATDPVGKDGPVVLLRKPG